MQLRLVVRLAALLAPGTVAAAGAQVVEIPEVDIDPTGLVVGGAAGIALGSGEAFDLMGAGYSLHLFLGPTFSKTNELRAGITASTFPDDPSAGNTEILSVYLETYFRRAISRFTVGVGPRIAWIQHSRAVFGGNLRSFGFGGVASVQLLLGSGRWIETGITVTSVQFNNLSNSGVADVDRRTQGAVWEFHLGMAFRVWGGPDLR